MIPRKAYHTVRLNSSKVKCSKCKKVKRVRHMALYHKKILCSCCVPDKIGVPGANNKQKEGGKTKNKGQVYA